MRVALFQMNSGIDPDANAASIEAAIAEAAAGGATMLFTPEMSGLLDRDRKRAAAHISEEQADRVLTRTCAAAAARAVWVSLGSLAIRDCSDGRLSNRSFVIDDQGEVVARYDKMHMFDVDVAEGESYRESAAYAPGDEAVTIQTPLGTLGLTICYDLRFPALHTVLTDAGATVIAAPAAFTVPTGEAHWHVLQRARAIENAAFVIAAAQTGAHQDGRRTYGHSLVIDPWGKILLDMGDDVGVGFCDIDLAAIDDARSRVPVIQHRRPVAAIG